MTDRCRLCRLSLQRKRELHGSIGRGSDNPGLDVSPLVESVGDGRHYRCPLTSLPPKTVEAVNVKRSTHPRDSRWKGLTAQNNTAAGCAAPA